MRRAPRAADYRDDELVAFAVDWRCHWRDRADELERRLLRTPAVIRPLRVRLRHELEQARASVEATPTGGRAWR